MSLYQHGMTLKALLEDPNLINPPKLNAENTEKKHGKSEDVSLDKFQPGLAYLGGQLWETTLPYDGNDFNLEYMDLDEFLCENGLPESEGSLSPSLVNQPAISPTINPAITNTTPPLPMGPAKPLNEGLTPAMPVTSSEVPVSPVDPVRSPTSSPVLQVDYQVNEQDIMLATVPGQEEFNPVARKFSDEELRPQPMIKKSKKIFVPSEQKDDKYWQRRHKNNVAAKRSRDARRIKENQIALRASFLETENSTLRQELRAALKENKALQKRIEALEGVATLVNPVPVSEHNGSG